MNLPSELEKAWFAGIVDGEGSIQIAVCRPSATSKNKRTIYSLYLQVGMTHLPTLKQIEIMWGELGHLHPAKLEAKGGTHPYWIWGAKANKALIILEAIYPYLITKKNEAAIAIYFQKYRQWRKPLWGAWNIPDTELDKDRDLMLKLKQARNVSDLLT